MVENCLQLIFVLYRVFSTCFGGLFIRPVMGLFAEERRWGKLYTVQIALETVFSTWFLHFFFHRIRTGLIVLLSTSDDHKLMQICS